MAWQSTLPEDPVVAGWWRAAAERDQAEDQAARDRKIQRIIARARLARLDAAQAEMAAQTAARPRLAPNDYESAFHYLRDIRPGDNPRRA